MTRIIKHIYLVTLTTLLIVSSVLAAGKIQAGESELQVEKTMGKPMGKMQAGTKTTWIYANGNVVFESGEVSESDFLTSKQFAQKLKEKEARAKARDKAALQTKARAQFLQEAGDPSDPDSSSKVKLDLIKQKEEAAARKKRGEAYAPPFTRISSNSKYVYAGIPVEFDNINLPADSGYKVNRFIMGDKKRDKVFGKLKSAMMKYPEQTIASTINIIYYAEQISSKSGRTMGLASIQDGVMILTGDSPFHHEYGHILMYQFYYLFPLKEWLALNKSDYNSSYGAGYGVKRQIEYGYSQGFVSQYSRTHIMEDVSETIQMLLVNPGKLFQLGDKYPSIGKKTDLLIEFLEDICELTTGEEIDLDRKHFKEQ